MLSPEELKESPLFQNISYESYLAMYDCFQAVNRSFRPYEVMYDYTSGSVPADSDSVGVIERGTASLIRIDENGVATVLEELGPGGVFGKALAFAGSSQDMLEVVCRTACEVVYIRYSQILKRCENACLHHSLLVQNMLRLISEKAQTLSQRVDVLSRRTIREKLLCCFQQLSDRAGSPRFTLPFTLATLADYIAADRSAMMRELKKMREEGLVETHGRQVTLCRPAES